MDIKDYKVARGTWEYKMIQNANKTNKEIVYVEISISLDADDPFAFDRKIERFFKDNGGIAVGSGAGFGYRDNTGFLLVSKEKGWKNKLRDRIKSTIGTKLRVEFFEKEFDNFYKRQPLPFVSIHAKKNGDYYLRIESDKKEYLMTKIHREDAVNLYADLDIPVFEMPLTKNDREEMAAYRKATPRYRTDA